jgi:hypothetical protein
MGFVSTGANSGRAASLRHFSVLTDSPLSSARRRAHGRLVEAEGDQLELAREVVPIGVCPSSAARCVKFNPRREKLVKEPLPVHASHVLSPAQLPIRDDQVEACEAEGSVHRRDSGALGEGIRVIKQGMI